MLNCQGAMALGTLYGGWRIVRMMGSRITHLMPVQGFCAETGGALPCSARPGSACWASPCPRPPRSRGLLLAAARLAG